jgi:hypothetical protein
MLNKANLFVPLMVFYGYDWESGEFFTRSQDSKSSLAPEAEVARPPSVDLTEDPECAAEEAQRPPRSYVNRPIFEPLGGTQGPAQLRMTFFDFVVWDIARAFTFLGLAETANGVTEDMVASTESFMTCLLEASLERIIDSAVFEKTISLDGYKRLEPGRYSAGDAVSFVMASMTLAMGGRLLIGNGGYTDAPTPSPLIQVHSDAHNIYVLDTFAAANMVDSYEGGNIGKMACFFQRRHASSLGKPVALNTDATLFVCVNRPQHYVSMIVEHLGHSDDTAAAPSMMVADSCPLPSFSCRTHDAVRIALKSIKLIGKDMKLNTWASHCRSKPSRTAPFTCSSIWRQC